MQKRCIRGIQALVLAMGIFSHTSAAAETAKASVYDLAATSITGKEVKLSEFRGKVALIVNTASKCGFTGQYEELEEVFQKYKDGGFVVLGFPSNDFGGQEPGSNEEILHFCKLNYGVTFPLFAKAPVKGADKQPVYRVLTEQSGKKFAGDPGWNFVKFLVDKQGAVRARFSSMTNPAGSSVTAKIEQLLAE